jgi:hypothetical protein
MSIASCPVLASPHTSIPDSEAITLASPTRMIT